MSNFAFLIHTLIIMKQLNPHIRKRLRHTMLTLCMAGAAATTAAANDKSIVILYENDVHCAIDGYAAMCGLRDAINEADTCYVGMVSAGDFLQGALSGAISHGQYVADIMRHIDYDAVTLGNHEFDYGVPRMLEMMAQTGAPVVCANFFVYGGKSPVYQPYVIKQYGKKRIAFVGVTTPESMRSESYAFVDGQGRKIYDLRTSDVYSLVQQAADKARSEGADYVVVISHLGEEVRSTGITSHGMIAATRGIDAVIDGHTHAVIADAHVANIDGKLIPISQTGTQFANIGKLLITTDGRFSTSLIADSANTYSNARVAAVTDSINTLIDAVTSRKIATLDHPLPVKDADQSWRVRHSEAAIGDLVADAFRSGMNAEIGIVNGGGLRNGLPQGTVNYGDIVSVQPFDNHMCLISATGEQIIRMLTKCTEKCPKADGSFPHVSGMRYTIHTATHRVSNVMVLDKESGKYLPLQPEKKYTLGVNDYYANGGFYSTLKDCTPLENTTKLSRDIVADYMEKTLGGTIGKEYNEPQGRITIIND